MLFPLLPPAQLSPKTNSLKTTQIKRKITSTTAYSTLGYIAPELLCFNDDLLHNSTDKNGFVEVYTDEGMSALALSTLHLTTSTHHLIKSILCPLMSWFVRSQKQIILTNVTTCQSWPNPWTVKAKQHDQCWWRWILKKTALGIYTSVNDYQLGKVTNKSASVAMRQISSSWNSYDWDPALVCYP